MLRTLTELWLCLFYRTRRIDLNNTTKTVPTISSTNLLHSNFSYPGTLGDQTQKYSYQEAAYKSKLRDPGGWTTPDLRNTRIRKQLIKARGRITSCISASHYDISFLYYVQTHIKQWQMHVCMLSASNPPPSHTISHSTYVCTQELITSEGCPHCIQSKSQNKIILRMPSHTIPYCTHTALMIEPQYISSYLKNLTASCSGQVSTEILRISPTARTNSIKSSSIRHCSLDIAKKKKKIISFY